MLLKNCGLNPRTLKALEAKKLETADDYMSLLPVAYHDYTETSTLRGNIDRDVMIEGVVDRYDVYEDPMPRISVKLYELGTDEPFTVTWFHQNYRARFLDDYVCCAVCVAGTVKYDPRWGYQIASPVCFEKKERFKKTLYPRYRSIKGVSPEMRQKLYRDLNRYVSEDLEVPVLEKAGLILKQELYPLVHFPQVPEEYMKGTEQLRLRDLLYFASHMIKDSGEGISVRPLKDVSVADAYIRSLPFALTEGQQGAADSIRKSLASGKASRTLVQGDVGCGKTAVAIYALLLAAGSGSQAVLMAPTTVLAKQHFEDIKALSEKLSAAGRSFTPVYLSGELTAKEKKDARKLIEDGTADVIVGTHSVITESCTYRNLGLVIVDEEHRFGVKQREALAERASSGLHQILMSATPIPRTLAKSVYGDGTEVVEIKTLPGGRKPVRSCITASDDAIFRFLEKQLPAGRQAYVVCPLIADEDDDSGKGALEDVYKKYRAHFGDEVRIAIAHGKLKKKDLAQELDDFREGRTDILISTTVIEVGVNVPNANVIVIENAEMFGLATLHQLRGRVGRGSHDSYCIFKSEDKENPRLNVLVDTTDGFRIAEEDMKLRGTGNLIGLEQTGFNKYVALSLMEPELYSKARETAAWALRNGYTNMLRSSEEDGE